MRRPFQTTSPKPALVADPVQASQATPVDAGLEVPVKSIVAAYAERGVGQPTRDEIHAIATATLTATSAVMQAAINTAIEPRVALK